MNPPNLSDRLRRQRPLRRDRLPEEPHQPRRRPGEDRGRLRHQAHAHDREGGRDRRRRPPDPRGQRRLVRAPARQADRAAEATSATSTPPTRRTRFRVANRVRARGSASSCPAFVDASGDNPRQADEEPLVRTSPKDEMHDHRRPQSRDPDGREPVHSARPDRHRHLHHQRQLLAHHLLARPGRGTCSTSRAS